jgi:hypothetical protein
MARQLWRLCYRRIGGIAAHLAAAQYAYEPLPVANAPPCAGPRDAGILAFKSMTFTTFILKPDAAPGTRSPQGARS